MAIWRKTFAVYQRNACKSITDERGRAGSGENDLCQKKKNPLQNTTCASRLSAQVMSFGKRPHDKTVEGGRLRDLLA